MKHELTYLLNRGDGIAIEFCKSEERRGKKRSQQYVADLRFLSVELAAGRTEFFWPGGQIVGQPAPQMLVAPQSVTQHLAWPLLVAPQSVFGSCPPPPRQPWPAPPPHFPPSPATSSTPAAAAPWCAPTSRRHTPGAARLEWPGTGPPGGARRACASRGRRV